MGELFVAWTVVRRCCALVAILMMGCAPQGRTPRPPTGAGAGADAEADLATRASAAPDALELLDKQVEALYEAGKFGEAIPIAERSHTLRERTLGARHPDIATSYGNLGRLHQKQGSYERAESFYLQALHLQEELLGPMDPAVGARLVDLAIIYYDRGMYARAEPLYRRALEIAEHKSQGAADADVAACLTNLANLYLAQGDHARAEPLSLRAAEMMEQVLGAAHPSVAVALNNLATIYWTRGAYAKAEPLFVRALAIRERAHGAAHPGVASTLGNLAGLYREQGAYAKAEPLLRRALELQEKALGAMHPDVAGSLNNLAMLYHEQGAYARAEPLWARALDIREKVLGAEHPDLANTLNNLAMLYEAQGAYAKAEPLYLRALAIKEKALGGAHPDVASVLDSLASIHEVRGEHARAESLRRRAIEIHEKTLGAKHPDVAIGLNNLAHLYIDQGAYARAEPLLRRALEIWEQALGAEHPQIANGLNNLAMLFLEQGAHARAEPLLRRALEIEERALGATHPRIAERLSNLAGLYQVRRAYDRAEPLLARALEIREANLRVELVRLSESRKRELMLRMRGGTDRLVSLQAHAMPASPRALELAFTTVLRRKGRVLDSLVDTYASLRAQGNPRLLDKLDELADAGGQLSRRLHAPFEPGAAEQRKREIASLRVRIDELEAELGAASEAFRAQAAPVTLEKVRAALAPGSALIELVRYHRFDEQPAPAKRQWREARYLAYVLPARGPAQWVALGEATQIEAAVDAALAAMRGDASAAAAKAALRNLDALVLAPIRGKLAGVSHVIVSPDGKLNLVPFEALIDPQGRHALERYLVSYVTSGRDLLRLGAPQASRSAATIVADPDYGPAGKPYVRADGTLAEAYGQLPGTRAEADGIRGYFASVQALTRGEATKAALAEVRGPSVLHVATHAFYARAGATSVPARPAPRERGMAVQSPPPPSNEDPIEALDRAGLALAGANVGPDGIVSARELASRDWWGTQMVVLSACGTGVGAVPSGEGVYGLRRALVLAGARSQVVSLWNVNDSSAPELMREFYAELARGTGRAEALRRAKLRVMRQPRFAHPYYWAAFIHAGDWAPLAPGTLRAATSASAAGAAR